MSPGTETDVLIVDDGCQHGREPDECKALCVRCGHLCMCHLHRGGCFAAVACGEICPCDRREEPRR